MYGLRKQCSCQSYKYTKLAGLSFYAQLLKRKTFMMMLLDFILSLHIKYLEISELPFAAIIACYQVIK